MKTIDQSERRQLCETILTAPVAESRKAAAALVELYRSAGYSTLAKALTAGGLAGAQRHAEQVVR